MNLISREFIRNMAPQLDLLNTLGGGIAQAQMQISKQKKGVVIRVAAPGMSPENIHVVLNDSRMTVFGEFRHHPEDELAAPLFTRVVDLPANLDLLRIEATHENNELQVRIPYQDSTNQPREIEIKQR